MLTTLMYATAWLFATALLVMLVGGGARLRSGADPIPPQSGANEWPKRDAA